MRRPNRAAEFGLQVLWGLFSAALVLLLCASFFGGTYALLQSDHAEFLDLLLLGLFLIWQLAPILLEGYSPGLNFREVARYPISFRVYFLLNLAYGLSDPAAIACILWLFSMWLAILLVRPDLALAAAFAYLLFVLINLLCNRIVIGLFDRFQSTRKGRERMVLIMLVLLLLPQLLQVTAGAWARGGSLTVPPWVLAAITWGRDYLPPGLTARAFLSYGNQALWPIVSLLLIVAIALVLMAVRLRAVFQGEIHAETYKVARDLKVAPGWSFPILDEITSAIVEKEMRYIRQNSRLLLQLIYPPIIFVVLAFYGPGRGLPFAMNPGNILTGLAAFLLLSLPNLAYNTFGMDKEAFGRWLLSPMPLRKVFLAKNITHGGIIAFLYLLVAVVLLVITPVGILQIATVTVGFFAVLLIQLGAGNLVSVHWPKRVDLTQMSSRMASSAAGLTSLLVLLPLVALWAGVAFAAFYWRLPWLPLAFALVIFAAGIKLYSYFLGRASTYTFDHIEEIAGNLGA